VAVALVGLLGLSACTGKVTPVTSGFTVFAPEERQAAPTLSGELLDGSTFEGLPAGQVAVINFWGSWCPPCVAEAPELEGTYQAQKPNGVVFLGIDVRDPSKDDARAFAKQHMSYPSIYDFSSRNALGFAVAPNAVPATFLIDKQGRIAAVSRTAVVRAELEPLITALLAEES
jgi:thiol-disulfide isomerase/thioredoxin